MDERRFTADDCLRPQLINFNQCDGVLIEDVTLLRSPFWVIHPLLSKNVTVSGVHISNDGPNGDGCDPESCDGVVIENCFFNTGDDCIAIKSGPNNDGRLWDVRRRISSYATAAWRMATEVWLSAARYPADAATCLPRTVRWTVRTSTVSSASRPIHAAAV